MQDRSESMLVIGAGPVGLAVAKALLEHQIPYEQIEADDDVGGNWYHGVYATAHIISSRKTTEYSDFPMPDDYPDFPSREQMVRYLRAYADYAGLRPHIQFNTKVVMCRPLPDERWEVELADGERRIYKGVLVCNGHHWDRRFPVYPGTFAGEYYHSKDYKSPDQLAGRRVLVVGGGNSACDVAAEAARVAKSCHLSLRRGYWFLPKTLFGRPLVEVLPGWVPVPVQRLMLKLALRVVFGQYEKYGLPRPNHRIFEAHPTLNSELLHYVKHGRIRPKPGIARLDGHKVHFADGSIEEFDTVICATGYYVSFPFLPPGMVPVRDDHIALVYGGVCLPDYKHLYIVGTMQPRYGFGPLITRAGGLICEMIRLQDRMELPIGLVMKETGQRPPDTHLVNPHAAMRQMWLAERTLPMLLKKEQKLREKFREKTRSEVKHVVSAQTNPDLRVY
ncbi:MAG TPA: NAD(P)-binding domain-containing protein [Blastocatellia bacterium]|nr:NAD(P)-binding domain-containing protein [Blastocatellia bacterium]